MKENPFLKANRIIETNQKIINGALSPIQDDGKKIANRGLFNYKSNLVVSQDRDRE